MVALCVFISVVVVAGVALGDSHAASATSAEAQEPIPEAMFCGDRVVEGEAVDELELKVSVDRVNAVGADLFGKRYGGLYFDRASCPPNVTVMIKDGTEDDFVSLAKAFEYDPDVDASRVQAIDVEFTRGEIEAGAAAASEQLQRYESKSLEAMPVGVSFNEVAQTITVDAPTLSKEGKNAIDEIVDPSVKFMTGDRYRGFAPTSRSQTDFPPYEAGLFMTLHAQDGSPNECTSGFALKDAGNQFASTAAHCVNGPNTSIGDTTRIGGTFVGTVNRNAAPMYDAVLISLSDDFSSGQIHISPNNDRRVSGMVSDFPIGKVLYFRGMASGQKQVTVNRSFYSGGILGSSQRGSTCVTPEGASGDSGGPVYKLNGDGSARAAGLISFELLGESTSCFTRINKVLETFNVVLKE